MCYHRVFEVDKNLKDGRQLTLEQNKFEFICGVFFPRNAYHSATPSEFGQIHGCRTADTED